MNQQNDDFFREMQLVHFGKLMASLSHEFKNHLAIIKESNGLLEDLLFLEDSNQRPNNDRLKKIIATVNERVAQAAEMCRFLSSFAHRVDQPLSVFSIAEVVQEEMYLLRRLAHQKQTELKFLGSDDLPLIFNNPSLLQFVIFCIIWPALEQLQNTRVTVTATGQGSGVEVMVYIAGLISKPDENLWRLSLPAALPALKAEFSRIVLPDDHEEIRVNIPSLEKP